MIEREGSDRDYDIMRSAIFYALLGAAADAAEGDFRRAWRSLKKIPRAIEAYRIATRINRLSARRGK